MMEVTVTDEKHGYGPPKVHDYSVILTSAQGRESLAAEAESGHVVKITLHGEGFIERAMPLIVRIGDHVVMSGFELTSGSLSFYLDELPEDGAVIQVGYGGEEFAELPERFSHSKVHGIGPVA